MEFPMNFIAGLVLVKRTILTNLEKMIDSVSLLE